MSLSQSLCKYQHAFFLQDPITGKLVNADYRISESAWLPANTDSAQDEKLRQFRKRISIITGLTMERAEDIQYSNYGIGGQYEVRVYSAKNAQNRIFDAKLRFAFSVFQTMNVFLTFLAALRYVNRKRRW